MFFDPVSPENAIQKSSLSELIKDARIDELGGFHFSKARVIGTHEALQIEESLDRRINSRIQVALKMAITFFGDCGITDPEPRH